MHFAAFALSLTLFSSILSHNIGLLKLPHASSQSWYPVDICIGNFVAEAFVVHKYSRQHPQVCPNQRPREHSNAVFPCLGVTGAGALLIDEPSS